MVSPLMPKSTALWLIKNTTLTFQQIAEFSNLHILEIQNLADYVGENHLIVPFDPVASGQLSLSEIRRCEKDPETKIQLNTNIIFDKKMNEKQKKYIPLALRANKPHGIAWLIKHCPEIPEKDICKLLGTTKIMVSNIKNKTYWNSQNLKPQSPVVLGLCSQLELDTILQKYSISS